MITSIDYDLKCPLGLNQGDLILDAGFDRLNPYVANVRLVTSIVKRYKNKIRLDGLLVMLEYDPPSGSDDRRTRDRHKNPIRTIVDHQIVESRVKYYKGNHVKILRSDSYTVESLMTHEIEIWRYIGKRLFETIPK